MDNIKIQPDLDTFVRYATERIVRMIDATLEMNDVFTLALSGGSTPKAIYELLGQSYGEHVDWERVHLFWGDERVVPPDDPQSNYRMVKESLLQFVAIPEANIHRIQGELDAETAAQAYEQDLKHFFGEDEVLFDLSLLGLGDDGHTASLFPHTAVLQEHDAWVKGQFVDKLNMWRITMTAPTILRSANIMFLATGQQKANVLKQVMEGDYQPELYPAQLIAQSKHEHLVWIVDTAVMGQ